MKKGSNPSEHSTQTCSRHGVPGSFVTIKKSTKTSHHMITWPVLYLLVNFMVEFSQNYNTNRDLLCIKSQWKELLSRVKSQESWRVSHLRSLDFLYPFSKRKVHEWCFCSFLIYFQILRSHVIHLVDAVMLGSVMNYPGHRWLSCDLER